MADEGRSIKLPERSTRGKRMRAQLQEEDNEADQEFWNQEFFAEDMGDADYVSEKEEEDVPDSDFFESESEPDEDEEVVAKERKKKTLRPPGAPPGSSRPRPPKPAPKPKPSPASASPSAAASDELPQSVIFEATYEAPSLRKSTRARVEEAQKEREQREQQAKATRRPQRQTEYRVLTQEELLAEAARTELDNLASLKQLLAQEEETKKKANAKKQRFGGPLIRYRSRTIQVLVPPEVAAREKEWQQQSQQQQQQQPSSQQPSSQQPSFQQPQQSQQQEQQPSQQEPAAAADGSADAKEEPAAAGVAPAAAADAAPAAAAAGDATTAAAGADAAGAAPATAAAAAAGGGDAAAAPQAGPDEATPMQVDQPPPQQQHQQQPPEQQAAAAPPEPEVPSGPVLQRQALDTLQCLGMKAPKWLLPQRAPGAANKPICPITGGEARYRDPLTGHWYSDADAFRELRRRLGQPLPPLQPYRRAAASPAAELRALLDSTTTAAAAAGGTAATDPTAAAAAAAGGAAGEAPGVQGARAVSGGGLPPGQLALQEYVEAYMQQQLAVAGSKGRGKSQAAAYYQQASVPDEVAALVLQVSSMVHG